MRRTPMPPWPAACLVLALACPSSPAGDARPAADRYGESLPAGAVARLGGRRLKHPNALFAVAFSPDGRILASANSALGCLRRRPPSRATAPAGSDSP
jgi:hypothetical protein